MSYTPPLGNQADLKFGGAYAAPLGTAADLSFYVAPAAAPFPPLGNEAHLKFGGVYVPPLGNAANLSFVAPTSGGPEPIVTYGATLGRVTQFGQLHILKTGFVGRAGGTSFTIFGTPSRVLDVASITEHVTCQASGWKATAFGTPMAPSNQVTVAQGFRRTAFGTPVARNLYAFTRFGTPTLTLQAQAIGFGGVTMGTPTMAYAAQGFCSTTFGQAAALVPFTARSLGPVARFGRPSCLIAGHRAYSIRVPVRFGRPTAFNRESHFASGWTETAFGTPIGGNVQVAMHIAPATTFGTPILKRSPTC